MSIVLKVTPEQLINAANEITDQISNMKLAFQALDSEIMNSTSYWEGDASSLHQRNYKTIKNEIETILKVLVNRPDDLLKMADLYKETEKVNAEIAKSLPNNLLS